LEDGRGGGEGREGREGSAPGGLKPDAAQQMGSPWVFGERRGTKALMTTVGSQPRHQGGRRTERDNEGRKGRGVLPGDCTAV